MRRGRGLSGSHDSSSEFEKDEQTEDAGEFLGREEVYELEELVAEVTEDLSLISGESEDVDGKSWWIEGEAFPTSVFMTMFPDSTSHI